ncbi:MAG: UDP-galactopyranose mutase [Bacteroidia bacterium]
MLSRVGRELYEAFYLGYTQKQWDMHPSQLDKSVCGRIPIRFNRDHRYVDHNFQQLPKNGYTEMFRQMIDNELIDLKLEADFFLIKEEIKPALATIYTGPIDLYFDYQFGKLPWRSLDFEFTFHSGELVQPCVQINHPNSHDYTRSVEIKHITQQEHLGTVVCKEYPRAKGEPYYPIPTTSNKELYLKYKTLAKAETLQNKVFFTGRLAQYTYINTDEAIEMALKLAEELFD